jgi:hypothetical protein
MLWMDELHVFFLQVTQLLYQLPLPVTLTSYPYQLPLPVTLTSYPYQLPLPVTLTSYHYQLPLPVTLSTFIEFLAKETKYDLYMIGGKKGPNRKVDWPNNDMLKTNIFNATSKELWKQLNLWYKLQ